MKGRACRFVAPAGAFHTDLNCLELDLDRASWVVEMALEWKDEKGTESPAELVQTRARNLFVDGDAKQISFQEDLPLNSTAKDGTTEEGKIWNKRILGIYLPERLGLVDIGYQNCKIQIATGKIQIATQITRKLEPEQSLSGHMLCFLLYFCGDAGPPRCGGWARR